MGCAVVLTGGRVAGRGGEGRFRAGEGVSWFAAGGNEGVEQMGGGWWVWAGPDGRRRSGIGVAGSQSAAGTRRRGSGRTVGGALRLFAGRIGVRMRGLGQDRIPKSKRRLWNSGRSADLNPPTGRGAFA